MRRQRQAEVLEIVGVFDVVRERVLMERRLDRLAIDRRLEPKDVLGLLGRHRDHEVRAAGDVGHRERDQRRLVLVAVVAELVADPHLARRDVEVLLQHLHVLAVDEREPARPQRRHRVVGGGRQCGKGGKQQRGGEAVHRGIPVGCYRDPSGWQAGIKPRSAPRSWDADRSREPRCPRTRTRRCP